jgi:hypothetical protein
MGTDVHMVGEKFDTFENKWEVFPIPDKFTGRYYNFFAAIGDVRNGYGFAGVYRHEPIQAISSQRGLPEDISRIAKEWFEEYKHEEFLGYPGDHSTSYVTLKELKEYDWPIVIQGGVLSLDQYRSWDKVSPPDSYCGGVSGGKTVTIDESQVLNYTFTEDNDYYVSVRWEAPLVDTEFVSDFIAFLELWKGWKNTDEDIRIVFNFDS